MKTLAITFSLAAALAIAACGSSQKPGSAGKTGPSFDTVVSDAYHYSACMRSHGVTNYPDPKVTNSPGKQMIAIEAPPGANGPHPQLSPAQAKAAKACRGIMPIPQGNNHVGPSAAQLAAREKGMLGFARCMRQKGIQGFPDPTAQGQLSLAMVKAANIDLGARQVQNAAYACVPDSNGQLTAATIRQSLAQAGQ